MTTANMLRLILLAAIWGSSFLFMRICSPVLGPALLVECRVAFAALFLALVALLLKKRLDLAASWKHFLILGFFNSAFPFLLFAYAAGTLEDVGTTSALTVTFLNPLFGILWGSLFLGEVVGWHTIAGAAIVITGATLVTGFAPRLGAHAIVPDSTNTR